LGELGTTTVNTHRAEKNGGAPALAAQHQEGSKVATGLCRTEKRGGHPTDNG